MGVGVPDHDEGGDEGGELRGEVPKDSLYALSRDSASGDVGQDGDGGGDGEFGGEVPKKAS